MTIDTNDESANVSDDKNDKKENSTDGKEITEKVSDTPNSYINPIENIIISHYQ